MFATFRNAFKIPELKSKLIFTLIILVLYRLGASIPVPFINSELMQDLFKSQGDTIFGYLNILSGDAFSKATLFALSISPYITSSIVMQLLTIAIPALEKMQKSGDDGRKKITQITRYVTVALGLITGYGYYMTLRYTYHIVSNESLFAGIIIVACYSAGSALIMWLGEKINENGIGNGISMILFANIISRVPSSAVNQIWGIIQTIQDSAKGAREVIWETGKSLIVVVVALVIIAFVVYMSNAERRIPVQYSKRVVGRKMYGGQSTYLPMKVNMSGVMPIIFASSMVSIPATIISFMNKNPNGRSPIQADQPILHFMYNLFGTTSILYIVLEFVLIVAFSYFYIAISFNPLEVSNNLMKNGGFIPGIRPGKPTTEFITKILNRIVLIGGLFLGIVAVFPLIINAVASAFNLGTLGAIAFGGSSLLIVVGVALETTREIEAQMTMRHYKGFLE
ncbi:MAG: preprotein translocase subunit SecY [Oscillospiraceae bacterium]|nr:preprotein translocase subunit SecY [Oscillospiraceae bacterium]